MDSYAKATIKRALDSCNRVLGLAGLKISGSGLPCRGLTAASKISLSNRFKNYHLGCGPVIADDFLNIDADVRPFTKKHGKPVLIAGASNAYVMGYDLRNGIPAADSSLRIVYHSHFLEHLTNKEGMTFLYDCYRCLSSGSVMRFAVPDFELWCKNYILEKDDFFEWYEDNYLGPWWETHHERALIFSGMLFNWGHKMAYDFSSLSARLAEVGFVEITRGDWGFSHRIDSISSLEKPHARRGVESLVVECVKPL